MFYHKPRLVVAKLTMWVEAISHMWSLVKGRCERGGEGGCALRMALQFKIWLTGFLYITIIGSLWFNVGSHYKLHHVANRLVISRQSNE